MIRLLHMNPNVTNTILYTGIRNMAGEHSLL